MWPTLEPGIAHNPQYQGGSWQDVAGELDSGGRQDLERQRDVFSRGRRGQGRECPSCCQLLEVGLQVVPEKPIGDLRPQPGPHLGSPLSQQHSLACRSLPYGDCYSSTLQPQRLNVPLLAPGPAPPRLSLWAGKMVDG